MALPPQLYNNAGSPAKRPMQTAEPDDAAKADAIKRRVKKPPPGSQGQQPPTTDDIINSRKQAQF